VPVPKIKVLAFCGSLRAGSYNRKLLQIAKNFARELNADVTEADLKELALPIYDQDIQDAGFPENVKKIKKLAEDSDVLLIASPEYNYSISGALKNTIDWLSRGEKNSIGGKYAVIVGASNGPYGTVRGQFQLRSIFLAVNVSVLPQPQVLVPLADDAFNDDGTLKNKEIEARLKKLIQLTFANVKNK
jgi:chromate reductase, NAD(P)H dehydrogenase (quinone)